MKKESFGRLNEISSPKINEFRIRLKGKLHQNKAKTNS